MDGLADFLSLISNQNIGQRIGATQNMAQPMPQQGALAQYGQQPSMMGNIGNALTQFGSMVQQQNNPTWAKLAAEKEAQARGLNSPSAVQEYAYWKNLPQEEQDQYLRVKRAQQQVDLGGAVGVRDPITGAIVNTVQKTVSPDQQPALKGQQAAAEASGKVTGAVQSQVNNSPVTLQAFEDLKAASTNAPSGKIDNTLAGFANAYPGASTEGMKKASVNQGNFSVKRAAAENQVRAAFRVAGSGAQTDADAMPIINMLPDPSDSADVKAKKIQAASEAVISQSNAKAKANGLPLPFPDAGKNAPIAPSAGSSPAGPAQDYAQPKSAAEYNQLPSGTIYIKDGVKRTKP